MTLLLRPCLALGFAALAGCTVSTRERSHSDFADTGVDPSPRVSSSDDGDADLSVRWTIDDRDDPVACADNSVDYAYVLIEDDVGTVDEVEVECEAFQYDSPPLPPGRYRATVALRDDAHHDLTEAAETDARDLPPGGSDFVVVDFPLDSFH